MSPLIEEELDALKAVCRRYPVARLEIFGSAADVQAFDPARSDVDFIVSFVDGIDLGPWLASYFDLREELALLLDRPVDLVMEAALRNPLFATEAGRTRRVVYAAQDTEAA